MQRQHALISCSWNTRLRTAEEYLHKVGVPGIATDVEVVVAELPPTWLAENMACDGHHSGQKTLGAQDGKSGLGLLASPTYGTWIPSRICPPWPASGTAGAQMRRTGGQDHAASLQQNKVQKDINCGRLD